MEYLKRKIPTLIMLGSLFIFCSITFLSGCTNSDATVSEGKLKIVATTTMLYDLTKTIGGDLVETEALMGPGIDPHLYQASAGDVTKMQNADIVVYNGLHLEGKMGEVFASLSDQGRTVICIEEGLDEGNLLADEENPSIYDPHIWFDVSLWQDAASHLAKQLS